MRILIADDHNIVRAGLKMVLAQAYPFAVFEEAADTAELLAFTTKYKWDVIISDISMPGRSGAEVIKQIKEMVPDTPVLILSTHPAEQYAVRTIKAGASGYLVKDSAPEELVKAVEYVMGRKKHYITPEVADLLAEATGSNTGGQPHDQLSEREFEVFKLIASGKRNSEIAELLSISINTIGTYKLRIREKTHLHSNSSIIKYALDHKLIE